MPDTFVKDPVETLDYDRDWKYKDEASRTAAGTGNGWLATGETITTSTWAVPTGITQTTPAPSHTDGLAKIWLTGGTDGVDYTLTNTVVTNTGRTGKRSITIQVRAR
jgi:hypothetical protein